MSVLSPADERLFVSKLGTAPLTEVEPLPTPWAKRSLDILGALFGVIAFGWLFALIALAIKLDSRGPVFFRQLRLGKDGEAFSIWKFRTMVCDAESQQRHEGRDGLLYKDAQDPRVTSIGRFLRASSLDELPQLFNVLAGEMSLVGPRPLPCEDTRYYQPWQWARLEVLPGMTGLWQVSGRSNLDAEQMVKLDLSYIQGWTFATDLRILLKTVWVVLVTRDGAY